MNPRAKWPYDQPLPAALTAITQSAIPFRFDQVVRFFFQLLPQASATFTQSTAKVKANWDTAIALSNTGKVIYSPVFSGLKIPESQPLEVGANTNATFAGIPELYSEGVVRVTGTFRSKDAPSMLSMQQLTQFSLQNTVGGSQLGVWMVNKDGYIFGNSIAAPSTAFDTFMVYNFRTGARGSEGLNSPDIIPFSFDLLPTWDQGIAAVIPTAPFDPIADYAS
jgi:hypothetical protein